MGSKPLKNLQKKSLLWQSAYQHDTWCEELPADVPELAGLGASHLFDTVAELLSSEEPSDGDGLEEADPQQRHARGGVKVHQLEQVDPAFGTHGQAQQEHEETHAHRTLQTY